MADRAWVPVPYALLAATLFGSSTPLQKILVGEVAPVLLVAFMYLGTAVGMALLGRIRGFFPPAGSGEAAISGRDLPWLLVAILAGGVIAPVLLMYSLSITSAATASLLLNFEGVATATIAFVVFRESVGPRIWLGLGTITLASILLSWSPGPGLGWSAGSIGVLLACVFWGVNNNATRRISGKDPVALAVWKGLGAGSTALVLAIFVRDPFPGVPFMLTAMLLGFLCYGVGMVLYIRALRGLGAARTGAYATTAPFIGAALSFAIFHETPDLPLLLAVGMMLAGALLLATETHLHRPRHPP